ncbi:MAG: FAD-dependent oxidoreductase, partial [Traorella sp.]
MERIAELYANESKQAKDLGFDAIFLHFGHGWLPTQFISPLYNHREDEYGGSIENRAKFPLMILKKIREAVGPTFPVEMRISGEDCVPGSIEFKDTLAFILMAEEYIDSVQISAGLDINHEGNARLVSMAYVEHMPNVKWAKEVKKHVKKIKVSVVGAIQTPQEAEDILAKGYVDTVAFGRSFNADPYWPNKARDGKEEDIRPCIRCNQCYHITTNRRNVGCSVNPRYHNENMISKELKPTTNPKKVVVIGGGPAGIQCAITASKRGHQVILLEKENEPGGTLNLISKEYYKEDIRYYLTYLKKQLEKSNVEVRVNCEATPEMVKEMQPDALVVAVGGEPVVLPIKGVDLPHVITYEQAIEHHELVGKKPLIIGGGTIGTELAIEISELQHKDVTIVELSDKLAPQGNVLYRIALRQKYEKLEKPLSIYYQSKVIEIKENEVLIEHVDGSVESIETDSVILCTGVKSKRELIDSFYGITPEIYEIGDAIRPRLIQEATFEGYGVGETI